MNTKDITITKPRAKNALNNVVTKVVTPKIEKTVKTAVENSMIRTGVITKFYPYIDKAEVKLDKSHKKVLCKILHRFGGEITDFFTPLADRVMLDSKTKEKYVIPRATQHVCVLNIHDDDSKENIILGYYQNKDIAGFNPAKPGNIRLTALGVTNDFYIQFGLDGLSYKLPKKITGSKGFFDDEMVEVTYADSDDVYTKDECYNKEEVYTKEEVDELIAERISQALGGE